MAQNLIGKEVKIIDRESFHYGDWGTVVDFDGEYYYIAIFGDVNDAPIFTRNQFKVSK
jgi:hypothetical protein